MTTKDKTKTWMVRAGSGSELLDEFLSKDIIAIGWNEIGQLESNCDQECIKEKLAAVYPEWSDRKISQSAGQIRKFYLDFKINDNVVTYDSSNRTYYLGTIVSEVEFDKNLVFKHVRKVEWEDFPIDRDDLSPQTKNTLGSILTIFELSSEIWEEFKQAHPGYMSDDEIEEQIQLQEQYEKEYEENIVLEFLQSDFSNKAKEFIKDKIAELSWEELEVFVAGLLRAMGYKTRMSPKGPDMGTDIYVSPDSLGMEEPRIKVEVKKRTKDKIQAPEIRSFIGGLRNHDKGIFVAATTGFTKDARIESERANFPITLIDSDWLAELLLEYYEKLDSETRALVPLKKIYWPL